MQSESPRKRILTEIGIIERSRNSLNNSTVQQKKWNRLDQVFRFSPNHSHQISAPDMSYRKSGRSKIKQQEDPIHQLNNIFRERKFSNQKAFFGQKSVLNSNKARSKSKINKDIEHAQIYIQNLRNKKQFFQDPPYEQQRRVQNQNKKQTITAAIGLSLPQIKQKSDIRSRFLTEPNSMYNITPQNKKKDQIGLYSYLQRDFVSRKQMNLTKKKIINYSKNPNNRNFHKIILEKSRNFLKHQAETNFKQLDQIDKVITQQSKKIISQQLQVQKQKYQKEYFVRNNVPYFSFLTLNQKQKKSVLRSLHRKRSIS